MIQTLPKLTIADFGPNRDHVAESYHGGKVFAMLHRSDLVRRYLPNVVFDAADDYLYVFVHGAQSEALFDNDEQWVPREIPVDLVTDFLQAIYGSSLSGLRIRLASCYGNLVRPGEPESLAMRFAKAISATSIEAYAGLVTIVGQPRRIELGSSVMWDASLQIAVSTGLTGSRDLVVP